MSLTTFLLAKSRSHYTNGYQFCIPHQPNSFHFPQCEFGCPLHAVAQPRAGQAGPRPSQINLLSYISMNKYSYGNRHLNLKKCSYLAHVSCCRQGCRQPAAGWGGLKWAAMSWDWCEPSWQDGCELGLRAGNHRFEADLCSTFFHVPTSARLFFTYVKKSRAEVGLEPVISSSQAQLTTVLPGRLTPIPRHCCPFQPTPACSPAGNSSRAPNMSISSD